MTIGDHASGSGIPENLGIFSCPEVPKEYQQTGPAISFLDRLEVKKMPKPKEAAIGFNQFKENRKSDWWEEMKPFPSQ